ncbi:MAG: contractile injection system tape measure protein [Bacteroidota bacterium]
MNNGNHIIQKVFLEINTPNSEKAYQIENNVSMFLKDELFPGFEKLFQEQDTTNQVIRYDRIEIDIAIKDWENSEAIKFELVKELNRKLSTIEKRTINQEITTDFSSGQQFDKALVIESHTNNEATFLFFLEHGYLPWYGKEDYIQELTHTEKWKKDLANKSFFFHLKSVLQKNETARERFILQFSDEHIISVINQLGVVQFENPDLLNDFLWRYCTCFREKFFNYLLKLTLYSEKKDWMTEFEDMYRCVIPGKKRISSDDYPTLKKFNKNIQKIFTKKSVEKHFLVPVIELVKADYVLEKKDTDFMDEEKTDSQIATIENNPAIESKGLINDEKEKDPPWIEADPDEIAVHNAGLVLFHPFLKHFFENLDWLDAGGNIKSESRLPAVQVLHYIATGVDDYFEANLILEKFLCAVPLKMSVPRKSLLTEEEKNECEVLLEEVIKNWPAIKNTSPDGLREMFVHRDGKLIQKEKGFKLIVERKAQDVLLEKLQWNISIVKLPWKDDLLFVEW